MVEVGVFTPSGYGSWPSTISSLWDTHDWLADPWELVPVAELANHEGFDAGAIGTKSVKAYPDDRVEGSFTLTSQSSTDLKALATASLDLVITDPPFGDLIQYSELSDFFYVWVRWR